MRGPMFEEPFDLSGVSIPDASAPEHVHEESKLYVQDRRPNSTPDIGQNDIAPTAPPSAPPSAARGAGVTLLMAVGGASAGAALGGGWGACAGLLLMGALRNGARARKLWGSADPAQQQESAASATMALVGGAAGAYMGYRAYRERRLE